MTRAIVHSREPVALVGGGELAPGDLAMVRRLTRTLVAADGGARAALAAGWVPEAVIGDFDSLDMAARAEIPAGRLHCIAEQESTDFDKALRHIAAPLVLGVGFLGGRVDHELAALNTLVRHCERACLLLGPSEAVLHLPPVLALPMAEGETVSIFPMAEVRGRSQGLFWPIDGLTLRPGQRIGTSNRATGALRLEMRGPGAIGLFPRSRLGDLARARLAPGAGQWPAPA